MNYDKMSDIYSYKGKDVLINKLGIKDKEELEACERAIVSQKLLRLHIKPYDGDFSSAHYLGLHKYLFEDIYPFAGKIRTVDIIKGNTYFARIFFIRSQLKEILDEMKSKFPKAETIDEYATLLTEYYLALNLLHPFREGNGRCEREFLREYVLYLNPILPFQNVELDYTKVDKDLMLEGTIKNNSSIVKEEFIKALIPIEITKKK